MDLALRPAPRGGASTSGRMYGDRIPAGPRDPSLWSDSSTTTQMDQYGQNGHIRRSKRA
jgi:hypothetical protein